MTLNGGTPTSSDNRWFDRAVAVLANLGFALVGPDASRGDETSHLLVAIRPAPTEQHYDPEEIDYWVIEGGRGRAARLDAEGRFPIAISYSWGRVVLTDRLGVRNEFLSFGGALRARTSADGTVVADFNSTAPILRWGGHSQERDPLAAEVASWFARLTVAINFVAGSEAVISAARPDALYCAFIQGSMDRLARSPGLREANRWLVDFTSKESRRLQLERAEQWQAAAEFRLQLESLESVARE